MKNLIKIIASFFYLGYVPFAPGTAGSLGALVIYLFCRKSLFLHTVVLLGVCVVGFLVCGPAEKIFGRKDSPRIVIDEVAGLLLAYWGLELDLLLIVLGFILFRVLDAAKVYPVNKLEKLKGAWGVMGDDLCAGLYTNIALQIATRFFPIWF
ncbi:MAG: phosphatidylglycerophosphatase A [Candidatus Omnitrophica bacterium]|nr:phosphatidylglycerophosphatase A [Candidatus Omnitrophota bacterium]